MVISNLDLVLRLRKFAPDAKRSVVDSSYSILVRSAPERLHFEWIESAWSRGLKEWKKTTQDCDEWAWLYRAWCLHRNIITKGRETAFPVGYIHFETASGVEHAMNFHIIKDGDGWEIQPFEPQPNGGPTTLTDSERESIDLVII